MKSIIFKVVIRESDMTVNEIGYAVNFINKMDKYLLGRYLKCIRLFIIASP